MRVDTMNMNDDKQIGKKFLRVRVGHELPV